MNAIINCESTHNDMAEGSCGHLKIVTLSLYGQVKLPDRGTRTYLGTIEIDANLNLTLIYATVPRTGHTIFAGRSISSQGLEAQKAFRLPLNLKTASTDHDKESRDSGASGTPIRGQAFGRSGFFSLKSARPLSRPFFISQSANIVRQIHGISSFHTSHPNRHFYIISSALAMSSSSS